MNLSCLYKAFCACCCLSERCIQVQAQIPAQLPKPNLKIASVVSEELKKVEENVKDKLEMVVDELKEINLNPEVLVIENLTEIVTPLEKEGKKIVEGMGEKITTKPFENYIKSYFS
jgi:hypothetical protein